MGFLDDFANTTAHLSVMGAFALFGVFVALRVKRKPLRILGVGSVLLVLTAGAAASLVGVVSHSDTVEALNFEVERMVEGAHGVLAVGDSQEVLPRLNEMLDGEEVPEHVQGLFGRVDGQGTLVRTAEVVVSEAFFSGQTHVVAIVERLDLAVLDDEQVLAAARFQRTLDLPWTVQRRADLLGQAQVLDDLPAEDIAAAWEVVDVFEAAWEQSSGSDAVDIIEHGDSIFAIPAPENR